MAQCETEGEADVSAVAKSGVSANAHTRTFRLAIRATNNGHSLSAIFPVSPSPIGHFGKEQLGTDFGKAKLAGVGQRDRGGEIPAGRSVLGTLGQS